MKEALDRVANLLGLVRDTDTQVNMQKLADVLKTKSAGSIVATGGYFGALQTAYHKRALSDASRHNAPVDHGEPNMTIDQDLDALDEANAQAEAAKDCRDWCPPKLAARLVAEVRLLRTALKQWANDLSGCDLNDCNCGPMATEVCHTCTCGHDAARRLLRPDRKLGEP